MRTAAVIAGGLLALGLGLAACNPEPEKAEQTPAELTAAPDAAEAEAGSPLSIADLRRVCQASLAAIHGQTLDAVVVTGVHDEVVSAQWPAPVDGGLLRAECRVEENVVVWKPLGLPDPAAVRWMNQAGDPVNTYALKGDVVTVTVTMPDGTKQQSDLTVPANKEAA